MSGSYNRKLYDNCQFQLKLKESVTPGDYRLYPGQAENELNSEYCEKNIRRTNKTSFFKFEKRLCS